MPLLEVNQLNVQLQTPRGPALAVRNLSFSIGKGETLGLIGESGCGKSITALSILGLLPDNAQVTGSIAFDGRQLLGLTDGALQQVRGRRIGMIFQEPMTALNPVHSIGRQVAEPLRLHHNASAASARQQAVALLDRVGIPHAAQRFDAYPHQFSGGQRQRITIAMALACNPDLLIADEPTTALDVTIQGQILELIRDLVQERKMALILISHDLGVIANNAERMMVMYGGSVVEQGDSSAVFCQPSHPYTRGLFGARPRLGAPRGARLLTIPGSVPELADIGQGCAFAPRCKFAVAACALSAPQATVIDAATEDEGTPHTAHCFELAQVNRPANPAKPGTVTA